MFSRPLPRWVLVGSAAVTFLVVGTYYSLGPTACSRGHDGSLSHGFSANTLKSGGMKRCYVLYLPETLDPRSHAPLVLSLHGFASRPEGQVFLSQWNRIADREGFIVAYPQGTMFPVRWNSFPSSGLGAADDVEFLRDLVRHIGSFKKIDPQRVYISGMSNGGAMTHLAACEMADIFAAAGVVAGPAVDPPGGCLPSRPIPVMGFYGTADPLVSYTGGELMDGILRGLVPQTEHVRYMGAVEWAASWARRNGCSLQPEAIYARGDTTGVSYPSCADGAEVILYTVDGGGHSWPGGPSIPFLGKTSQDIQATETMWAFFQRHVMPQPLAEGGIATDSPSLDR